jgi:cytochrome c oxidase cbb3-type subunit 3
MAHSEHHDYDGITENREQRPPVYFTVLFYGLIIWGVAFSAFYLLSGWSSDAEFKAKMQVHEGKQQGEAMPAAMMNTTVKPVEPVPAAPKAPEPVAAVAPAADQAAAKPDAKALFAGKCAMCHGADAKGGFGPNLIAPGYEYGKNREAIATSIGKGRGNGKMPAFEGQLKDEEIFALADYLLSLK